MIRRDGAYFVEEHLRRVPVHLALIRSAEACLFAGVDLPRPLLDIGCGDGNFAATVRAEPVDAGVDLNPAKIREAARRGIYCRAIVADATSLPFPNGAFSSVMSNCAIEHVPRLDVLLSEVRRVLRPGGTFVTSVPSQNFTRYLVGATLPRAVGLGVLGDAYEGWFRCISDCYHTYAIEEWQTRMAAAGLPVVRWRGYLGPEAMRAFDLSHYYGAPTLVSKRLFGRWVLWPDKVRYWPPERWLARRLVRYCEEDPGDEAAYLFMVCQRDDTVPAPRGATAAVASA
ncbi:MAG TPA: class I SAM-dependent methyltransferase [Chloroflexota bacterium]|jgi:SAM-dependent methyltransferase